MNYRLPKSFNANHYDITIKPYFTVLTEPKEYDGKVVIKLECVEDTSVLILHMKDLELKSSTLKLSSETDLSFKPRTNFRWIYNNLTDFFIADFNEKIFKAKNVYIFSVEFKGFSQFDNIGIYRSSYTDDNNQKRYILD